MFAYHLGEDRKEYEEQLRDIAEYAMAFHNYDAVQSVRSQREQTSAHPQQQEAEAAFLSQVETLLGRKLENQDLEAMGINTSPIEEANADHDLDDIKIIK